MLRFMVFDGDAPATEWPLRNCYLLGADGHPMRADIRFEDGQIVCEKRESGTAALALMHRVGELGELSIQTCLLPEREQPYNLTLELARHRLMTLYTKLEDWSMFDLATDHPVTERAEESRRMFVEALCMQGEQPALTAQLAQKCLVASLDGTEELALAHSELLLNRRKKAGMIPKAPIGCGVPIASESDRLRAGVRSSFDFLLLPCPWRVIAPEEGEYRWAPMDSWVTWASRNRMPVIAGPVISFAGGDAPDWLHLWEHDYESVRDLVYEHLERVISRYKNVVMVWDVASGLHINQQFSLTFEQLMDMTRMAAMLVKKIQPNAKVMIELQQPFGEYYAANQRSIPPMMYADLMMQSGIPFDVLGLRLTMGQARPGQFTRDLMQVSNLLDHLAAFGKPVHLAIGSPSHPVTSAMIADPESNGPVDAASGYWRQPWSETVQSHWLEAVMQIAISKPFVDGVAWREIVDHPDMELPMAGLITDDLHAKSSLRRLVQFRRSLFPGGQPLSSASRERERTSGLLETPGAGEEASSAQDPLTP